MLLHCVDIDSHSAMKEETFEEKRKKARIALVHYYKGDGMDVKKIALELGMTQKEVKELLKEKL